MVYNDVRSRFVIGSQVFKYPSQVWTTSQKVGFGSLYVFALGYFYPAIFIFMNPVDLFGFLLCGGVAASMFSCQLSDDECTVVKSDGIRFLSFRKQPTTVPPIVNYDINYMFLLTLLCILPPSLAFIILSDPETVEYYSGRCAGMLAISTTLNACLMGYIVYSTRRVRLSYVEK